MTEHPRYDDPERCGPSIIDPWTAWWRLWLEVWVPPLSDEQRPVARLPVRSDNVIWVDFKRPTGPHRRVAPLR
jgi:hypothetical protein